MSNPNWREAADYWRGRTGLWMSASDAMANALVALLRDESVVAAATPEDLKASREALSTHPFASMLPASCLPQRLADSAGLVCEEHPSLPWPHGDCAGPGMLRFDVERP